MNEKKANENVSERENENGREQKKRDFCVGFFCALMITGIIAAILLLILNL